MLNMLTSLGCILGIFAQLGEGTTHLLWDSFVRCTNVRPFYIMAIPHGIHNCYCLGAKKLS